MNTNSRKQDARTEGSGFNNPQGVISTGPTIVWGLFIHKLEVAHAQIRESTAI